MNYPVSVDLPQEFIDFMDIVAKETGNGVTVESLATEAVFKHIREEIHDLIEFMPEELLVELIKKAWDVLSQAVREIDEEDED